MARLITLIQSEERRGLGTKKDPCRIVELLYGKDGAVIAEYDPCRPTAKTEDDPKDKGVFYRVHENGIIRGL